jgi:uncharacterized DUF497 family protein
MPVGGNMRLGFGRKVDKRTGEKENYVTGYKQYSKECTIRINYISTESIRAISVVKAVEEITGLNSVLAVVRDSNSWDVHERYNCIVGKNQRTIIILTVDFNSIQ